MAVSQFFRKLIPTDLFAGLRVTGDYFLRKKVTVQFPEQRREPTERFRGLFGYDVDRCIDCHLCARACPINIIFIRDHAEYEEIDGKKKKKLVVDRYDIDVKRCMFCGLCQEACPTQPKSIWLTTKTYEGANYERNEALYFTKERLMNWDGIKAFPGVVPPAQGQAPGNLTGAKSGGGEAD